MSGSRSTARRRRGWSPAARGALVAWLLGLVLLALTALWLLADLPWYSKLAGWVLLVWLADECGGWFGYVAAILGAAPFFSGLIGYGPDAPVQWAVAYPLVLVGLIGALLVKHAGGPLLLPVALALLVAPIFVARFVGPSLDTGITLPGIPRFLDSTLWPGLLGAAVSLAVAIIRRARRRTVRA